MKCGYKQCKFGNEVDKEIAVKKGNRYYHKECLQEAENKNEIRKLFLEHINENEVVAGLNRIINNIIDVKNVPSDFLLYALKYVIRNKLPLNYAGGLYYIINNKKIIEEYNKEKAKLVANKIKQEITKSGIHEIKENTENLESKIKKPKFMQIL